MATARPYRDFLTPSLHRRFTNAALVTLGVCYVVAVWMGEWNSTFEIGTCLLNPPTDSMDSILAVVPSRQSGTAHSSHLHLRFVDLHTSRSTHAWWVVIGRRLASKSDSSIVGARTSTTSWQTFVHHSLSLNWLQIICWYLFSAWLYCEVYIWSASVDSRLNVVDPGR